MGATSLCPFGRIPGGVYEGGAGCAEGGCVLSGVDGRDTITEGLSAVILAYSCSRLCCTTCSIAVSRMGLFWGGVSAGSSDTRSLSSRPPGSSVFLPIECLNID